MTTLFVEHLTTLDCAFLDSGRGLVGESWIVDIELTGTLDDQSMILDFSEVKKRLKRRIDAHSDHRLLIPQRASELQIHASGNDTHLHFRSAIGAIEHQSPDCAIRLIDATEINAASVAADLLPALKAEVPESVAEIGLTLRPEIIDGAYYHYTHGLKKHLGACQRIAHGHRSRVDIRVDDQRSAASERAVAARWTDIYLASREDVIAHSNGRLRVAYRAQEGHYQLALPDTHVDVLDSDTTVECIAAELANRLRPLHPGRRVAVRAYEGVNKGAIARSA
ncbi:6-carboxytetrahydropterin synthase [Sinimarinibacterium sp. NLF-5-8]|uniref:6-carboxytetrahydropterin synthase n=1 Tax=Sinimarinibacterium sp. NLF-5-8 TaxID=2698684 RepID=UPI00137C22AE|nr:6-carboxytetrahydropterin synthase [Sinimarinibacterium sp. NLF-5-8]QHS08941.1 hypothetical protein GT972_01470 [Sinimarinibacterium sp. NLF-5-8]